MTGIFNLSQRSAPPTWRRVVYAVLTLVPVAARAAEYDLVIYGGTSSGVVAAVAASREGLNTALVSPTDHLGGLTTSGLGATDYKRGDVVGGVAREFYHRIHNHYLEPKNWNYETRDEYLPKHWLHVDDKRRTHWFFEPSVAILTFDKLLDESPNVEVVRNERLDLRKGAGIRMSGNRIDVITTESGKSFEGRIFIDATYEGDLMAMAGVSYIVGREPNSQYNETANGIGPPTGPKRTSHLDPYLESGNPESGLLPGIEPSPPGEPGAGDERTQAYNFRVCLTDVPKNRIPIDKPDTYDPLNYELLARHLVTNPEILPGTDLIKLTPMPNRKTDSNNRGLISTDWVGYSYDWAEAGHEQRNRIAQAHRDYTLGLIWFLTHDPRVPSPIRKEMARWGLPRDEFEAYGHFPPQLYVREARRMIGEAVMTESDCRGRRVCEDPIGMGAYPIDCHAVTRYLDDQGRLRIEGGLGVRVPPYSIGYCSIVPQRGECDNLLVPICVSASHAAYGSIRMEPVFMILGQSAATAASLSVQLDVPVQDVPYEELRKRLLEDGQVLELSPVRQRQPDR